MTLGKDQIDQDALAAEWGLALEADAANVQQAEAGESASEGAEAAASQWQAMVDDGGQFIQSAKGGAERILNQVVHGQFPAIACHRPITITS